MDFCKRFKSLPVILQVLYQNKGFIDLRGLFKVNLLYQPEIFAITAFNPLEPSVAYLHSLKTSEKPLGFLMFSGGIDKQNQALMS